MSISTMNDDLNILQNLAIPAFEEDVDVIQKLDDEPNDVGGLTAAELKAKFDEAGNRIKTYLNETLVPSISETVAEAEERAEAEAARVLAEEQRVTAEQERVAAEAEREQAEAERRAGEAERAAAEAERKTAEDARVLAEQNRVDTDSGIVAQATSAAEAAENAANKAASAAIHQPIVGDNGNWHTWSFDAGAYVDTGIYAGGDAPYIGENGNWYVGQTDTGVSATSTGVYVGSGDMPGGYNLQIDPDGEETDFIPYIGANGNWFVGDTDLNVPATGPIGPIGVTGATGPAGPAGSDGVDGADGKSAYQYAVEGGYTGTEEAFAAKLAEEMPDKLPNPNALTFTGAVTGRYDGSAPLEVAIPSGGGGLTVTNTAAVGQTVKIAAVDETGQPTEWEAVDMTSGGGGATSDEWIDLGTLTLADGEEAINFSWKVNGQVKKIHIEGVYYSATSGKNLSLFNSDGLHGASPLITYGAFKFPSSAESAMYMDLTVEELYPGYWFGVGGASVYNNPHENTIASNLSAKRVDSYLSLGAYWRDTPLTAGTWFNVKVVYY